MDVRKLREQTRREHEATESALPLMDPGLTMEAYKSVLCALLPIIDGWERWIGRQAPESVGPLLAKRRRSDLLRQDLRFFGVEAGEAVAGREVVDWAAVVSGGGAKEQVSAEEFEAGVMGAFYVMEGSTLGGRFIARQVEAAFGLEPGRGDAYFQGHGEATGALWRETTAAIAAVPEAQSDRVIAAARRAFEAFGKALRSHTALSTGRGTG